ncbi:hypothetical protein CDIK_1203 [Cucumispora dikerogammari]|nr:hypothetical protein CDIK_1203 [Cucumispora dikerogammari]
MFRKFNNIFNNDKIMFENFFYDITHGMNHGTGPSYLIILKGEGAGGKSLFARVLYEALRVRADVVDDLCFKAKTTNYVGLVLADIDKSLLILLNEMKED